jgi:protein MpaA
MKTYFSLLGQAINVLEFGSSARPIFLIGGVHGDEAEGIAVCAEIARRHTTGQSTLAIGQSLLIMPCANPDGQRLDQRSNSRNIDLNRNLPTTNWKAEATNPRYQPGSSPASEPETKAFLALIAESNPKLIVSIHSFTESLLLYPSHEVNSEFRPQVNSLSEEMKIPVVEKMNYEIFGSLSRWGLENDIATLTIELLRKPRSELYLNHCANQIESFLSKVM